MPRLPVANVVAVKEEKEVTVVLKECFSYFWTTEITDAFADRENSQQMLTLEKSKEPAEWIY